LDDTTAFLEIELSPFNTVTGTSNMAENQIKMKNNKPIKQASGDCEVSEGCLPNAPHKLHPRSTKESELHQQFGPDGWILADPTGRK